jgi:hypothetical protein
MLNVILTIVIMLRDISQSDVMVDLHFVSIIMPSVITLRVVIHISIALFHMMSHMLSVIMQSIIKLSVTLPIVILLRVIM